MTPRGNSVSVAYFVSTQRFIVWPETVVAIYMLVSSADRL